MSPSGRVVPRALGALSYTLERIFKRGKLPLEVAPTYLATLFLM